MDFSNMTLREKVLQTFVVTAREINKHGGPQKFFEKYPVGGMYYMYTEGTEGTVEKGTGTNPARLEECIKASKLPLFVCADFANIDGHNIQTSLASVAAANSKELAYGIGRIMGMQMNGNKIDWILGPIVDLLYEHSMPLFGWSDDPLIVARLCGAIVRGIQEQGVCATVKHFPGLGTCNLNMHFGPGRNILSFEEWERTYGYVYKEMFKENVCSVMTTHTTLEAYDSEMHDGYYPIATFSKKLTEDLLKNKMSFEGAVVTDALIMGGMATGDLIEETVQAFKSGADWLLWPPVEAADRIVELLESGEIPMSRLDDALERINKMRIFREKAVNQGKATMPDVDYMNKISEKALKDGMCLLRNEKGIIPLSKNIKNILIVDASNDKEQKSANLLNKELLKRGFNSEVQHDIYDVPSRVCWQDDLDELAEKYDMVIFNIDAEYATAWNEAFMLIWASHLFDKSKKLIINYGSPFFAPTYFPEDPTFVEVNASPDERVVEILADKLMGLDEFTGSSIVKNNKSLIKVF